MDQLISVRLALLDDGENVRLETDAGLRRSIAEHGVLQPITVCRRGRRFEVLYGHRRTAAARALGLVAIPAIVVDRPADLPLRQLAENLDRRAVDPLDVAAALRAWLDAHPDLRQVDLARAIGRSPAWVNRKLALLELSPDTIAAVREGRLGEQRAVNHLAAERPNATGRPRLLAVDELGRSRSIVVGLRDEGQATIGIDRDAAVVDLVLEDRRGRGLVLALPPDAARLLGRRLLQAGEALRPLPTTQEASA